MNRVRTWAYINQTIVVILVVVTVRGDIAVVDPDVGGFFYLVSLVNSWSEKEYSRTAKASPLSARTFLTPKFRMITFEASLTILFDISFTLFSVPLPERSNSHSKSLQHSTRILANNASVASNLNLIGGFFDIAAHDSNLCIIALHGRGEFCIGRDGCSGTACTTSGAAVHAGIAMGRLRFLSMQDIPKRE